MNGILLVNKDAGVTSRDVINDLNHILHTNQIGHTGTLDPIATGVLVCTIGKYTKLGLDLTSTYKEYVAEMKLGYETDTLDITGKILKTSDVLVNEDEIKRVINSFVGTYNQEVPIYSSVKVNGKKLYEYARSGEEVTLPSREVTISSIDILNIDKDIITFKCMVSKGTYIRSLIRDIGIKLNTYATMTKLNRTKQGKFDISSSYKIEDIRNNNYKLLSLDEVLDLEIIDCDIDLFNKVNNSYKFDNIYNKEYVLFRFNNIDICLYKKIEDNYRMYIKM